MHASSLALFLALSVSCSTPEQDRAECFEIVCRTIQEDFYDLSFGGVDWKGVTARYQPRVEAAETDEDFYVLMNEMLFELGVSHVGLIPDDHPEWIGAPSVFSDGTVGVDARILGDEAVVVRVHPGSPGDEAGICAGALLIEIDGKTIEDIRTEALSPPLAPLDHNLLVTQGVQQCLFGPKGSEIEVTFSNVGDEAQSVILKRIERPGRSVLVPGIPPSYLEFESRRVGADIGYLRFNAFDPALLDRIDSAMDELSETIGIVIDLRGNPGGAFQVRRGLAERLVTEPCTIWRQRGRRGVFEVNLEPPEDAYRGVVVVLTDALSCSSSEEFAGGLQALGRATVIGEKTTGIVLIANVVRLEIGATLVYPEAEAVLVDGSTLEGRGVTPDLPVQLDRASLAEGRDLALEAALKHIRETHS